MSATVLVVDDDPVQRRLLDAMLKRLGYDVLVAEGGAEALRLLTGTEGQGVDAIVLDLVMPELDGMAVLALTPAADATPLGSILEQLPDRVAVLVGAEGPGLTEEAMAAADHRVHIPMTPGTDSVNVATAAAIALAALYRPQG